MKLLADLMPNAGYLFGFLPWLHDVVNRRRSSLDRLLIMTLGGTIGDLILASTVPTLVWNADTLNAGLGPCFGVYLWRL